MEGVRDRMRSRVTWRTRHVEFGLMISNNSRQFSDHSQRVLLEAEIAPMGLLQWAAERIPT